MLLCAGLGTRLRPITDLVPKPLVPIGDRAAFLHAAEALRDAGFAPIAMNTHHRAGALACATPAWVTAIHEPVILGTAGGVRNAAGVLGGGEALVWNGDVVVEPDLARLVRAHRRGVRAIGAVATLLAVPRPPGEGTVGVDDCGRLVRLRGERFGVESRGGDFIGVQVLAPSLRDRLPRDGCLVADAYLPALRGGDTVAVAWHDGVWADIGTPRALLDANLAWLQGRGLDAWAHPTAVVDPAVCLRGAVVCAGARVRGQGDLSRALVMPGATVAAPAVDVIALADERLVAAGRDARAPTEAGASAPTGSPGSR
jgi:mannose-1-phosphate guanylyltransferase